MRKSSQENISSYFNYEEGLKGDLYSEGREKCAQVGTSVPPVTPR